MTETACVRSDGDVDMLRETGEELVGSALGETFWASICASIGAALRVWRKGMCAAGVDSGRTD